MHLQLGDLMLLLCGVGLLFIGLRALRPRRQMATSGGPHAGERPLFPLTLPRLQARAVEGRPDHQDMSAQNLRRATEPDATVQQLAIEISSLRAIVQDLAREVRTIRESLDSPRSSRA